MLKYVLIINDRKCASLAGSPTKNAEHVFPRFWPGNKEFFVMLSDGSASFCGAHLVWSIYLPAYSYFLFLLDAPKGHKKRGAFLHRPGNTFYLCPPRWGFVQESESERCWVRGFFSMKIRKLQGFRVQKFQSFKVPNSRSCRFSNFPSHKKDKTNKVSEHPCHVLR